MKFIDQISDPFLCFLPDHMQVRVSRNGDFMGIDDVNWDPPGYIVDQSCCRNKICVATAPVALAGERIICAPNHFLLEIEGTPFVDTVIG